MVAIFNERFWINSSENIIDYKNIDSKFELTIDVTPEMLSQFTREEEHLLSSSYGDREPRYGLVEIPCISLSQLTPEEVVELFEINVGKTK